MRSEKTNMRRRHAIRHALVYSSALVAGMNHCRLSANQNPEAGIDNNSGLTDLVNTLRAMENTVCTAAATIMETSLHSGSVLSLHLRNADLNSSEILKLANALDKLEAHSKRQLASFSLSYNTEVGDFGSMALARSLPMSLKEIGFVDCGIRDTGALALLNWAQRAPSLKMICIEHNNISSKTRSLFNAFSRNHPDITVIS